HEVRLLYYLHLNHCFLSSRRRHTTSTRDWSSDVCSSDLQPGDITFVETDQNLRAWQVSKASAAVVPLSVPVNGRPIIRVADPLKIGRASCRERVYGTGVVDWLDKRVIDEAWTGAQSRQCR